MKEGYTATTGDLMADIIPNCRVHTHQVKLPSGGTREEGRSGEDWRERGRRSGGRSKERSGRRREKGRGRKQQWEQEKKALCQSTDTIY